MAAKHDLQLRDEHFDRATMETEEHPRGGKDCHEGPKKESRGHKAREAAETDTPSKAKNPTKTNVLRGSADGFPPLRERGMGAEGLEPFSPFMEKQGGNTVEASCSEIPGAQAGAIDFDFGPQGQLKRQVMADFERAWMTLKRWEATAERTEVSGVQKLRSGLGLLINETAALMTDSE